MSRLNGYLDSFVDQCGFRQHGGIFSGISKGDQFIGSSGTISISGYLSVSFTAVGTSGLLGYSVSGRFGESWKSSPPFGYIYTPRSGPEDILPIGLSGYLGFFDIYRAGSDKNYVELNATYGDLIFVADTAKIDFAVGQRANMRLSGIFYAPVNTGSTNEFGDIHSCLHSVLSNPPKFAGSTLNNYTPPTTTAEKNARALGIGTIFVNTGSGVANLSFGSGVEGLHLDTYRGASTYPLDDKKEQWIRIPVATQLYDDRHFTFQGGPTGVSIHSPGLYRCSYHITANRLSANATGKELAVRAVLYQNSAGNGGGAVGIPVGGSITNIIPQSISYGYTINTNIVKCDAKHSFLFNADGDDFFALEAEHNSGNAVSGDGLELNSSGCVLMLQKVGPKRGNIN